MSSVVGLILRARSRPMKGDPASAVNQTAGALSVDWLQFKSVGDKDTTGEGDIYSLTVGMAFQF